MGTRGRYPRAISSTLHHLVRFFPSILRYLPSYSYPSVSFPLLPFTLRNFEDEIFVRWIDCNTPFPEYVPCCVFSFSVVFFVLLPVFNQF